MERKPKTEKIKWEDVDIKSSMILTDDLAHAIFVFPDAPKNGSIGNPLSNGRIIEPEKKIKVK